MKLGLLSGQMLSGITDVLDRAELSLRREGSRVYTGKLAGWGSDVDLSFGTAEILLRLLRHGRIDVVIVGLDKLLEYSDGSEPDDLARFAFPHVSRTGRKTHVILCSRWRGRLQLNSTVATEYPNLTRRYLSSYWGGNQINLIEVKDGSAESLVVSGGADYAVVVAESGTTLRANGLYLTDRIMETTPVLVCRRNDEWTKAACGVLSERTLSAPS